MLLIWKLAYLHFKLARGHFHCVICYQDQSAHGYFGNIYTYVCSNSVYVVFHISLHDVQCFQVFSVYMMFPTLSVESAAWLRDITSVRKSSKHTHIPERGESIDFSVCDLSFNATIWPKFLFSMSVFLDLLLAYRRTLTQSSAGGHAALSDTIRLNFNLHLQTPHHKYTLV